MLTTRPSATSSSRRLSGASAILVTAWRAHLDGNKKDETTTDSNALEKKELDRRTNHHGPMKVQIVERAVEVHQVMTQEVMIPVVRPYPEYVDVQCANPIVQTMEKTVEVPQVQYTDRIVGVPVTAQRRVPTIQTAQRTVEMPPMTEEVVGVPKIVSQDRIPQRTAEQVMDSSSSGCRGAR